MFAWPQECELTQLQRSFAEAILHDDAPIPSTIRAATGPASASRFGVYRNNVIAGLINALAARYPVVRKLLWEDSFNRVARLYVIAEPPRSPVLLEFGESFPRFLRRIGQGTAVDYLADIAELEAARTRAYHAADEKSLGKDAFARLPADQFAEMRVKLHPSIALLKSRYPIVSIWESNVYAHDNAVSEWKQESALVARPQQHVEVHRLSPGDYEFLSALLQGQTVGAAVAHAASKVGGFDLSDCFTTLITSAIVVGFQRPPRPPALAA
jgi:hypothetical protein